MRKNILFYLYIILQFFIISKSYSQQQDILGKVVKKTIPEFNFADLDKNGFITNTELDFCIDKVLDNDSQFVFNEIVLLSQYFKGEYIPINDTSKEIVKPTTITTSSLITEVEPESLSFFDKYISFGLQLTGFYQLSTGLKKTDIDGPVSLPNAWSNETITMFTFPFTIKPWKGAEFNITPEFSAGNGMGNGAGLAAYPNGLYAFPSDKPYLLRGQYRQTFILDTSKHSFVESFNISVGQFILQEMLSVNPYASNPKMDFMNFAHNMLNGWDAATTAYGYTYGIASSIQLKRSQLNFVLGTVNKEAGGPKEDFNIAKAHSFNLQYAQEFNLFNKPGTIRILGCYNSTFSGVYEKFEYDSLSNTAFFSDSLKSYQSKICFAVDADLALTENIGLFARYSWGDGKTESWGYTQCDASIAAGVSIALGKINRPNDGIGICGSYNTLSKGHQTFLKNGGSGFMIGDGFLNYAPETVGEFYYRFNLIKSVYLTFNYQYMLNVGYNYDRGNTHFLGGRLHIEL